MFYEPEANLISIDVARGQIYNTVEMGNFIIHISKAGKPILIEILDASKFVGQIEKIKDVKKELVFGA